MKKSSIHFGTDGWRAVIARDFTFENVKKVILAISGYLIKKGLASRPVIIGCDFRFLSEHFAQFAAEVFSSQKIPVLLAKEPAPTPVIAYSVIAQKAAGAVMLTASHNPPEYQGLKFIPDYAGPASKEITEIIEKNLARTIGKKIEIKPRPDLIKKFDPGPAYFKQLYQLIDFELLRSQKLKIVFDAMFGVGRGYLDFLLTQAGQQVQVINGFRDAFFGGILPEPKKSTLKNLAEVIKAAGADLGLATDGDADRFGVVDKTGNFISPEAIGSLLFEYLVKVKKTKGAAVKTVAMTHTMDKIAAKYGVKLYTTPVGFKYLAEIMLREPVIIGCEQSSGISIKGHIPEKDGIMACLLVLEMLAHYQKPLSQVLKELMQEFGHFYNDSFNLTLPEKNKSKLIRQLKKKPLKKLGTARLKQIITIDGVKLVYADASWFLVRPSGTEPLVRLYFEAPTEEKLHKLESQVRGLIKHFEK